MTCLSGLLINVFLSTLIYDFLCSITIQSWRNSYHVGTFYLGQPESAFLDYDLSYLALGSMIFYSLCSWNCTFEIKMSLLSTYLIWIHWLLPPRVNTVGGWLVTSNAWHDFWRGNVTVCLLSLSNPAACCGVCLSFTPLNSCLKSSRNTAGAPWSLALSYPFPFLLKFCTMRLLVPSLSSRPNSLENFIRGPLKSCSWPWGQALAILKGPRVILMCSYDGTHSYSQISSDQKHLLKHWPAGKITTPK